MKHILVGEQGEKQAITYLKKKGYKIIAHNYHNVIGEIDIIAKDKDYLVFVEVKTRTSAVFGQGYEAVNTKKQQKIRQVATLYLKEKRLEDVNVRFDVMSIDEDGIHHFINAF